MRDGVGLVAIGRNEGERLRRALTSAVATVSRVVYVDSGSTDGSVDFARSIGVQVVALDLARPFTAGRARNAGMARLLEQHPATQFVQFIDGDCVLDAAWIDFAADFLSQRSDLAIVGGLCNEMNPQASVFNRIGGLEWNDFAPGEAASCGGNLMVRVRAFQEAGGFHPGMIAGEEPELCFRLRQAGWRIWRVDRPMVQHDLAMFRIGQWWRRCRRGGHAQAEFAFLHRNTTERPKRRENRSAWMYGLAIPALALVLAWPTRGWSLALFLIYPLQIARTALRFRRRGWQSGDAWLYALQCISAKFPQMVGQMRFHLGRIFGKRSAIIEYK